MNQTLTANPRSSLADRATPDQKSLGILLVDDDADYRHLTKEFLEHHGHRLTTAGDGKKALNLFGVMKDEIDLVILDYIMPGLDGLQTLALLRQLNPAVKVILVSGAEALRVRRTFSGQRVNGHLQKPALGADLLRVVHEVAAVAA